MSTGHGEKRTRKREQAIIALLTHPTLEEAAAAVGISKATLWRWTQEEDFQREYQRARRQAVSQAIARLQHVSTEAVNTLESVMKDPEAPAPAKVTAAKTVLDLAVKAVELEDLEARMRKLERTNGKPQE